MSDCDPAGASSPEAQAELEALRQENAELRVRAPGTGLKLLRICLGLLRVSLLNV